ncbi:hypothetical protein GGR39_002138 [Novosphingobium fluoreni]|uniref:DNA-binding protein n=1 Tax=Novosphingobium fluoreni TaxID=1391222 RepID=A0A7W6C6N1_9SPHN|nr:Zn-ribbon domain-containing OB-fold protein [Novosphingobium fluoreni]MBB3940481.1 hypothetical protein [Novosphingobium fluoreni]
MASAAPRFDLPTIEDETRPFWDALREGRLMIARCGACGKVHYYPRPMCPSCWSEDVSLVEVTGRGTLYTWSTVYVNDLPPFNTKVPYVAAQVDLEEGVRLTTMVVDAAPQDLEIGMKLQVVFEAISDDVTIPVFAPARS